MKVADIKWFFPASYRYIAPRGFVAHLRFAMGLPRAAWRFFRSAP